MRIVRGRKRVKELGTRVTRLSGMAETKGLVDPPQYWQGRQLSLFRQAGRRTESSVTTVLRRTGNSSFRKQGFEKVPLARACCQRHLADVGKDIPCRPRELVHL